MKRVVLWGVALALFGCRTAETSSVENLAVSERLAWEKKNVSVCWANEIEGQQDLVREIQQMVQKEYTEERTGIYFYGWSLCDDKPADVRITWKETFVNAQANTIGRLYAPLDMLNDMDEEMFDAAKEGKYSVIILPKLDAITKGYETAPVSFRPQRSTKTLLMQNILHELGHVAGLFHEHAHVYSSCEPSNESEGNKEEEFPDDFEDTYVHHGFDYDPYSIMSYCKLMMMELVDAGLAFDEEVDLRVLREGLSENDAKVLKLLYGNKPVASEQSLNP